MFAHGSRSDPWNCDKLIVQCPGECGQRGRTECSVPKRSDVGLCVTLNRQCRSMGPRESREVEHSQAGALFAVAAQHLSISLLDNNKLLGVRGCEPARAQPER